MILVEMLPHVILEERAEAGLDLAEARLDPLEKLTH